MSLTKPFRHALPVNEALFHEALYLTHAGWERVGPGEPYPQTDTPYFYFEWKEGRTLPEFCLALIVTGSGGDMLAAMNVAMLCWVMAASLLLATGGVVGGLVAQAPAQPCDTAARRARG